MSLLLPALAFLVVTQADPTPPPEPPSPPSPEPAPAPAPVDAAPLAAEPAAPPTAPTAPTAPTPTAPVIPREPGFFDQGQPGHYLEWYGAEYVALVGVGVLALTNATDGIEPLPASIGPAFALNDGNLAQLNDPRLDDVIGRPLLQEKVPTTALAIGIATIVAGGAAIDFGVRQDLHRTHGFVVGGAEAVLGAWTITEVMKLSFGRLRPDFRERYTRAACAGIVERDDVDCAGVLDDGFKLERADLYDGMKSFPSGHASTSFAAATYLAMHIGARHFWSTSVDEDLFQPVAGLLAGGLLTGAAFVAATRVSDNRHHLEDVAVGAGVGVASGLAGYFIHFDANGRARRRGADRPATTTVLPMAMADGGGVAVQGAF